MHTSKAEAEAQAQVKAAADAEREKQRLAFLEKHHALLRQKLTQETEQRQHDAQQDQNELFKRQQDIQSHHYNTKHHQNQLTSLFGSPTGSHAHGHHEKHEYTYKNVEELDWFALKSIASSPELKHEDATCLQNVSGKYHTRYIRNRFPIAGSQIKLERERDLYLDAHKRLLFLKDDAQHAQDSNAKQRDQEIQHKRHRILLSRMQNERRVNLFVNKTVGVLKNANEEVDHQRWLMQFDFANVREPKKTECFWNFLKQNKLREALLWLKANEFVDVNVPMMFNTTLKHHAHKITQGTSASTPPNSVNTAAASDVDQTHCCSPKHDTEKCAEPTTSWLVNHEVGVTPLMAACRLLSFEMVQALLEHHAEVNLQNANGESAVHFIYKDWWNTKPLPPTIIDSATDLDKGKTRVPRMSMQEATALMVKCRQAQDILQLLHKHGANLFVVNGFGETLFHFIAFIGHLPTGVFLLELYAKVKDEQHAKAKLHNVEGFELQDAKDFKTRQGVTPLDLANQNHHVDLARILQNFSLLHKTKLKELEWKRTQKLLQTRGNLSLEWSPTPHRLLAQLEIEKRRAGHVKNQFLDRQGCVKIEE